MNSQELELMVSNMLQDDNVKQEPSNDQLHADQIAQVPFTQRHLTCIPNLDQVTSAYEFELLVPPDQNNNVVFNHSKLFIKMGSRMTISLSYREQIRGENLFLRAMILFSMPSEMHMPVKRCANHRASNLGDPKMLASILKINDPKAMYFGDEEGQTFRDRLSVVVPIESRSNTYDDNGKVTQSVGLEFGCQNSCSSGINRKPTSIVFTLENSNMELLGKSAIEFKVCSCPKRDSEREREPKRKMDSNMPFPRGKRPKYSTPQQIKPEPESESDSANENVNTQNESTAFSMTTVTVNIPTEVVAEFLKSGFNVVAGRMAEDRGRKENMGHYEKCLKDIKKLRKKFEQ